MQFKEGDKLVGIIFENNEMIRVGADCDDIIVVMESGQMAGVPWFEVWRDGRIISKWNAAKCDGVLYSSI